MSDVYRANRKASDSDIVQLNSVGLSLRTIAELLGCHPTTVTIRLKSLNIPPADTRRTFMEDIVRELSPTQIEWLASQLGPHLSIKDFIKNMLVEQYLAGSTGESRVHEHLG